MADAAVNSEKIDNNPSKTTSRIPTKLKDPKRKVLTNKNCDKKGEPSYMS